MKKKIISEFYVFAEKNCLSIKPCLKQSVYAMIEAPSGEIVYGSNSINNIVAECPRDKLEMVSGQGYHLCKSVCNQNEHAEVSAIKAAISKNIDIAGGKLFLVGHTYCCNNCLSELKKHGITDITICE